jgi:hypothetical protein
MSRWSVLLALALVLVPASMALASGDTASPPAPAPAAPSLASFLAGVSQCPRAELPVLLPAQQPAADEICGGCSDTACAGKTIDSVCGDGFRCILQPACTSSAPNCKCLIIG